MPLIDPYQHDLGTPPPKPYWYIIFTIAVFALIVVMAVIG